MPCYKPNAARRNTDGSISFRNPGKPVPKDFRLKLACGQCKGCRRDKQRDLAIRSSHEAQLHAGNSFITLTYDEKHLPENHSLELDELQNFFKRLRASIGKLRYIACGEYGPKTKRPHYHAIIFGHDFTRDGIPLRKSDPVQSANPLWKSEELAKRWTKGFHSVGEVTYESAAYVARYHTKKLNGDLADTVYQRVDPTTGECWNVEHEFGVMSLKPGLAKEWFDKYWTDVYPENAVTLKGGIKLRPPKYYDTLLKRKDPELHAKMLDQRRKHVEDNAWNATLERLAIREKCATAQIENATSALGNAL